jgi:hypothetical protein
VDVTADLVEPVGGLFVVTPDEPAEGVPWLNPLLRVPDLGRGISPTPSVPVDELELEP